MSVERNEISGWRSASKNSGPSTLARIAAGSTTETDSTRAATATRWRSRAPRSVAVTSGDVDAEQLAALVRDARDAGGGQAPRDVSRREAELRVWSVLTVDVVEGRIQTVRIVRNPDKLGHL